MIRPISINNGVYFKAKTIEGGPNSNNFDEAKTTAEIMRKRAERDKLQTAFIVGATVGSLLSAAGVGLYKNSQTEDMLKKIAVETTYEGADSLGIKDYNKDNIPEIVVFGKDGMSTVYDMKNNEIFIESDGELIKEIQ